MNLPALFVRRSIGMIWIANSLLLSFTAATAEQMADSSTSPAEEFIVTADRREASLLDVSASFDALSSLDLEQSSITTSFDLPKRIPSLVISRNAVLMQPYIRGVGSDLITVGGDPSVMTLVDGVPRTRVIASEIEFFDVDRVEVAKGPQSTLYGRNATGGVLHVLSKRPAPEIQSAISASGGSFEAWRIEGMINLPLVKDRLALRVAGVRNRRNGWSRLVGGSGSIDDQDSWSSRAKLEWRPSSSTSVLVSADYQREDSSRGGASKVTAPLAGSPAVGAGGFVPANARQLALDRRPEVFIDTWGASVDLEQTLSLLGRSWTLTSATSYRASDAELDLDLDGTNLDFVSNSPEEDAQTWTQELRISTEDFERLDLFAGVYFSHEDADQVLRVRIPPAGIDDRTDADIENVAAAIFVEGKIELLDGVFFTGGLRYSWERRAIDFEEVLGGAIVSDFREEDDWQSVDPRFVLEWRPDDRMRFYASASRGFKAGGYNTTVSQSESFDQESLWSYEVGGRASLWDRRLRLSGAIFYYDYDDIQLNVLSPSSPTPFPDVRNAGRATIWGAEIGTAIEPLGGLTFEFNLTALSSEFDGLRAIDPNDLAGDSNQSGNRLPRAPTLSFFSSAQYRFEWAWVSMTPRIEYVHQSKVYFSVFQDDAVAETSYGLINARIDLDFPRIGARVGVFGRNLTNQLYAHSRIRVDGQVGNLTSFGEPRVVGAEASFAF